MILTCNHGITNAAIKEWKFDAANFDHDCSRRPDPVPQCRIIELLHRGPQPVHILAAEFAISRPAISRHLQVLKKAKLINEKRIGRENLYRLHAKRLEPVQEWIGTMLTKPKPMAVAAKRPSTNPPASVDRTAEVLTVSRMGFEF